MKSGKKPAIFFILTAVFLGLAIVVAVQGVRDLIASFGGTLVTMEAPATASFTLPEAGMVTLWHDYQGVHGGKTISNPAALPTGFSFEVSPAGSGTTIMLVPASTTQTMTLGTTEKVAVGTFDLPVAGDYELKVDTPPGENRIFSLSEGTFLSSLGSSMLKFVACLVLALAGFTTLLIAIFSLIGGSKNRSTTPPIHVS